jgi:hypothetical protein
MERHSRDEHVNLKVLVEPIKNDLFPKASLFQARRSGTWVEE